MSKTMKCTRAQPLFAGAALALLAGACVSAPRYRLEVGDDLVRASAPDVAADVAELLVEGRALLVRRIPDLEETSVEIWVQDPASAGPLATIGADFSTAAYMVKKTGRRPRIYLSSHGYRDTLVHELAHALLGEGWRTLQLAPEEGLCSLLNDEVADPAMTVVHLRCAARAGGGTQYFVSMQVDWPEGEPTRYSTLWGDSGGSDATESTLTIAEILALSDSAAMKTMTRAEIGHVYGVGYLVARRVVARSGSEGLHELCLRATSEGLDQIPVPWLLEAAGIESDEHFEELALAALRAGHLRAAFESESFQRILRRTIQAAATTSSYGVDEFAERFEGTLRVNGTPFDLGALPEFQVWLEENWMVLRRPDADVETARK